MPSPVKKILSQIWMICELLPFVMVGQSTKALHCIKKELGARYLLDCICTIVFKAKSKLSSFYVSYVCVVTPC